MILKILLLTDETLLFTNSNKFSHYIQNTRNVRMKAQNLNTNSIAYSIHSAVCAVIEPIKEPAALYYAQLIQP